VEITADALFRHLLAGFVRLHVLYHADREPICGVEIMQDLRHHGYKKCWKGFAGFAAATYACYAWISRPSRRAFARGR
jgi:hypothetical protein